MIRTILLLAGVLAVGVTVVWTSGRVSFSNCGGNSAALAKVNMIALIARVGTFDAPDHSFRFAAADTQQREHLSSCARDHWIRRARFLVSTQPVFEHETNPRRVIVVCDTPYRNVPRQRFGQAPPMHAAGFADGSCGLISTAEFAALDHSTFTPLDTLYPPESERAAAVAEFPRP